MQIYFFGLCLPKLRFYLFSNLFSMIFWVKNWGIEKLPVPSFVTPISHIVFLLFLQKKKKREHLCQSALEPSPSSVSLTEIVFSFPFFGPCGKPWYQYAEAITWSRAAVALLDGDTASYVRNPDDEYSRRHRTEDYRYFSSLRPSPSYCAFISFHLCAVSSRNTQQRKMYDPTLSSYLDPFHIKLLVCNPWIRINRNNNRSLHNLNGRTYAEDSAISGKEAEVKKW